MTTIEKLNHRGHRGTQRKPTSFCSISSVFLCDLCG
jgi:hypothetical protein